MKQRRTPVGLLLLMVAVLGVACIGSDGPRGWAPPVPAGSVLIVSTGSGRLDGIDAEGRQVWRFPEIWRIPEKRAENLNGIYGPPQISADGEVVFVGDYNGYVYAFRPADFQPGVTVEQPLAASVKLNGPVLGGLLLDTASDTLYATSDNRLYAIRASDLTARIRNRDAPVQLGVRFEAANDIWGVPVLADGKLLVSSLDGNLYALDPVSGRELWRFEASTGLVSTPTVAGNLVLISGFGSTMYAIDLSSGQERWSFRAGHWVWGRPAISGGIAYFGDFNGVVHAVQLSNGEVAWSLDLRAGPLRASPVIANGMLVLGSADGWLIGVDISQQRITWQSDLGTALNADMALDGASVLISPRGCVRPSEGADRVYYTHVNPATGELRAATGVC